MLRPGGHVMEVFRVLHLLEIIPSFGGETQALASFQPRGYAKNNKGDCLLQSPPFHFTAEILSLFLLRCCAGSGGLL